MSGLLESPISIAGGVLLVVIAVAGCDRSEPLSESVPTPATTLRAATAPSDQLKTFCGNCHVLPDPSFFPREQWFAEVKRGFNFYLESGRSDLSEPKFDDVVQWYRAGAPEALEIPGVLSPGPTPVKFERSVIPAEPGFSPVVAGVNWDSTPTGPWPPLRLCDMSLGYLNGVTLDPKKVESTKLIQTGFLACSKVVDLDQDGVEDLLVADLGSRLPADHKLGRVLFLSGKAPTEIVPLQTEIGRVADLNAADFDGDSDLDIVVAEFGWLKTGGLWVLENQHAQKAAGQPFGLASFVPHKVDDRHGTIHVPVVDLNGDGKLDFVALISQEHEVVEAFLNEGGMKFRREKISPPQDPSSGSSGLEMVDIDRDGDQDFVYCLGDTLDSYLIKPYHGVRLLVNEGQFPFREVKLIQRPGACDTATADFDGDGDLDIAVCGYLPDRVVPQMATGTCDTVFWLEQTEKEKFLPHPIEVAVIGHLAITAGDFDHDGRIDLATGDAFGPEKTAGAIWWNRPATK